jgi:hypothetical protein
MNAEQFNQKYFEFLEEGHYGLDIDVPDIVEYLDRIFQELTRIPKFEYSQIKIKFDEGRFYNNLHIVLGRTLAMLINNEVEDNLTLMWEKYIKGT